MHQSAKAEPNQYTDCTVIGTDVCTCAHPSKLIFATEIDRSIYLSLHIYGAKQKFLSLQTLFYPLATT